jgi:hypothetical protein
MCWTASASVPRCPPGAMRVRQHLLHPVEEFSLRVLAFVPVLLWSRPEARHLQRDRHPSVTASATTRWAVTRGQRARESCIRPDPWTDVLPLERIVTPGVNVRALDLGDLA